MDANLMASPPSPPSENPSDDSDSDPPRRHPMSRFRDDTGFNPAPHGDPRTGRPRRRGPSPPPFILRQLQQQQVQREHEQRFHQQQYQQRQHLHSQQWLSAAPHQHRYFSEPAHTLFPPHNNGFEAQHQYPEASNTHRQHQHQHQQHQRPSHRPPRSPSSVPREPDPKEIAFLLPHLKPNFRRILHIACGNGTLTRAFCAHVPGGRVIGIDTDAAVIAHARLMASQPVPHIHNAEHNALYGLRNLEFFIGDVLEDGEGALPFPDREFDVVFCEGYLGKCADPVAAMGEMRRVVRAGGFVACRERVEPVRWFPGSEGLMVLDKYWTLAGSVACLPAPEGEEEEKAEGESEEAEDITLPKSPLTHSPKNTRDTYTEERQSCMPHRIARLAGVPISRITQNVSASLLSTQAERSLFAAQQIKKLEDEDVRQAWKACGASEEDFAIMLAGLDKWAVDPDGWYAEMWAEVVCWV